MDPHIGAHLGAEPAGKALVPCDDLEGLCREAFEAFLGVLDRQPLAAFAVTPSAGPPGAPATAEVAQSRPQRRR